MYKTLSTSNSAGQSSLTKFNTPETSGGDILQLLQNETTK